MVHNPSVPLSIHPPLDFFFLYFFSQLYENKSPHTMPKAYIHINEGGKKVPLRRTIALTNNGTSGSRVCETFPRESYIEKRNDKTRKCRGWRNKQNTTKTTKQFYTLENNDTPLLWKFSFFLFVYKKTCCSARCFWRFYNNLVLNYQHVSARR